MKQLALSYANVQALRHSPPAECWFAYTILMTRCDLLLSIYYVSLIYVMPATELHT